MDKRLNTIIPSIKEPSTGLKRAPISIEVIQCLRFLRDHRYVRGSYSIELAGLAKQFGWAELDYEFLVEKSIQSGFIEKNSSNRLWITTLGLRALMEQNM